MTDQTNQEQKHLRGYPMGKTAAAVAGNLRLFRGAISLRDLSDLLANSETPMSASALSRIETGQRRVDVDELVSLASVLKVDTRDLLGAHPETVGDAGSQAPGQVDTTESKKYLVEAEFIVRQQGMYEDWGYSTEQIANKLAEAQILVQIASTKALLAAMRLRERS